VTTDANDRAYYLELRRGLLKQLEAVERFHLPDKWEETLAARKWLEETRSQRIIPSQT